MNIVPFNHGLHWELMSLHVHSTEAWMGPCSFSTFTIFLQWSAGPWLSVSSDGDFSTSEDKPAKFLLMWKLTLPPNHSYPREHYVGFGIFVTILYQCWSHLWPLLGFLEISRTASSLPFLQLHFGTDASLAEAQPNRGTPHSQGLVDRSPNYEDVTACLRSQARWGVSMGWGTRVWVCHVLLRSLPWLLTAYRNKVQTQQAFKPSLPSLHLPNHFLPLHVAIPCQTITC